MLSRAGRELHLRDDLTLPPLRRSRRDVSKILIRTFNVVLAYYDIDFLKIFFVIRSTFHIAIVANSLLCQSKLRLICQSGHLRVLPYRNEPEPQRQLGHQLHRRYSH